MISFVSCTPDVQCESNVVCLCDFCEPDLPYSRGGGREKVVFIYT